jgi:hypothetical protein
MKLSQQIFQKKIHPKHLVTSIVNDIMQENRSFDEYSLRRNFWEKRASS